MVFPTAVEQVPPGYRFHPTDEELIAYYLSNKVLGKRILGDAVAELDIYDSAPWDLPELGSLRNRNLIGYFFCPRRERRGKPGRACRRTKSGYWKSTGEDRSVLRYGRVVGKRKTLIFHLGKSGEGERTNWVMYEFRLVDTQLDGVVRDSYVLCKIFEKSGLGPQNGEQYGAPFNEKDWEDDDDNETQGIPAPTEGPSNCNNQEDSAVTGILVPGHHYSGIVASSREPVSLENGALSSVNLPDPNACWDVVPILEGPQDQSMMIVINDEISLEELFEPNSNPTDAGMLAPVTGQDQVMQDANFDGLFSGLSPLVEEFYPSNNYAPQEANPAGDFLEQRDLDGALPSVDLPDPNACRNAVPIPEGPQGQDQVDVDFDDREPMEDDLCAGRFNNDGYAHQEAAPAGDFLEQRDLDNLLSSWIGPANSPCKPEPSL